MRVYKDIVMPSMPGSCSTLHICPGHSSIGINITLFSQIFRFKPYIKVEITLMSYLPKSYSVVRTHQLIVLQTLILFDLLKKSNLNCTSEKQK